MESGTNGKSNNLTYTLFSRYQQEVNDYGYGQRKGTQRPYISKAKTLSSAGSLTKVHKTAL